MNTTDNIIIIDLEATCWEGKPPQGQESEIIEIGICVLDTFQVKLLKIRGYLLNRNNLKSVYFAPS